MLEPVNLSPAQRPAITTSAWLGDQDHAGQCQSGIGLSRQHERITRFTNHAQVDEPNFTGLGGRFACSKLIRRLDAAGGRTQRLTFRAIGLNRKRDCPALDDLFVKELQCRPWFQSDLFQNGFRVAF